MPTSSTCQITREILADSYSESLRHCSGSYRRSQSYKVIGK